MKEIEISAEDFGLPDYENPYPSSIDFCGGNISMSNDGYGFFYFDWNNIIIDGYGLGTTYDED